MLDRFLVDDVHADQSVEGFCGCDAFDGDADVINSEA